MTGRHGHIVARILFGGWAFGEMADANPASWKETLTIAVSGTNGGETVDFRKLATAV